MSILEILNSLLQENEEGDIEDLPNLFRKAELQIKSLHMPPLGKNKWLSVFLNQIQTDLHQIDWSNKGRDNITKEEEERRAIKELTQAKDIILKRSDKGGNVVLMDAEKYEK